MKPLLVVAALGCLGGCTAPTVPSTTYTDIPWDAAVDLLQRCRVETVFQGHDLSIGLTTKDGRLLSTTAPHLDAVLSPDIMPPRCGDVAVILE